MDTRVEPEIRVYLHLRENEHELAQVRSGLSDISWLHWWWSSVELPIVEGTKSKRVEDHSV